MLYYVCDTSTSHLGHQNFDQEVRGGSGKVKICLELAKFAFRVLWRPLNGSRVPEIDSNLSGAVGGTIWGPFQDYLNHSGASGGLRSHVWGRFWRSVPLAANLVKILWIRMAFTCVRHIVLLFMFNSHLLGHFRPSKERWNRAMQLGENYHFFGGDFQFLWGDYHFWGPIPLLAATIYWG